MEFTNSVPECYLILMVTTSNGQWNSDLFLVNGLFISFKSNSWQWYDIMLMFIKETSMCYHQHQHTYVCLIFSHIL